MHDGEKRDLKWPRQRKCEQQKFAKSLRFDECEQSSNQQTTPTVPEGQPAELGQCNQQASFEVLKSSQQAFKISQQLLNIGVNRQIVGG